jgi:hypothetical protein
VVAVVAVVTVAQVHRVVVLSHAPQPGQPGERHPGAVVVVVARMVARVVVVAQLTVAAQVVVVAHPQQLSTAQVVRVVVVAVAQHQLAQPVQYYQATQDKLVKGNYYEFTSKKKKR